MTWPVTTLGEVATWGSGGTPRRSERAYFGDGVPWLSIADLNDGVVSTAKESLTPLGIQNSSAKVVPEGTIFVAMYGSIGKLGIAGREMCTSQAIAFAKPNLGLVDTRYLFHYLLSQRPQLQDRGRGGTQMNIGQADLKRWPIPLPPLEEQRRIAAILDRAGDLRAKREYVMRSLARLEYAIFVDMFGASSYPLVAAAEIMPAMRNGLSPARSGTYSASVLTLSAVTQGAFDPEAVKTGRFNDVPPNDKRVSASDFLMCRGNGNLALVGRGVFAEEDRPDLVFPDTVIAGHIDNTKVILPFLDAAWKQPAVRRQIEAVARTTNGTFKVNQQSLSSVIVPMPPIDVQLGFAERIRGVAKQRRAVEESEQAMSEVSATLQARAFAGQL